VRPLCCLKPVSPTLPPLSVRPKRHRMLLRHLENAIYNLEQTIAVRACSCVCVSFGYSVARYHSKNAPDFLAKMNNIVWTCCILHNLLLGVDGLDKLWTAEDYLSTWCAAAACG